MIFDKQLIARPGCDVPGCEEKGLCYFHTKIVCGKHILELIKKEQEEEVIKHNLWLQECRK